MFPDMMKKSDNAAWTIKLKPFQFSIALRFTFSESSKTSRLTTTSAVREWHTAGNFLVVVVTWRYVVTIEGFF